MAKAEKNKWLKELMQKYEDLSKYLREQLSPMLSNSVEGILEEDLQASLLLDRVEDLAVDLAKFSEQWRKAENGWKDQIIEILREGN